MALTISTAVRLDESKGTRNTVYIFSVTNPVKVQLSLDGTNWVDVFTQGAAGSSVYTVAHAATWLRVHPVGAAPAGGSAYYLKTSSY
jgi:hypothetical protein